MRELSSSGVVAVQGSLYEASVDSPAGSYVSCFGLVCKLDECSGGGPELLRRPWKLCARAPLPTSVLVDCCAMVGHASIRDECKDCGFLSIISVSSQVHDGTIS